MSQLVNTISSRIIFTIEYITVKRNKNSINEFSKEPHIIFLARFVFSDIKETPFFRSLSLAFRFENWNILEFYQCRDT